METIEAIAEILAEVIETVREVPLNALYIALDGKITMREYTESLVILTSANQIIISEDNIITWKE